MVKRVILPFVLAFIIFGVAAAVIRYQREGGSDTSPAASQEVSAGPAGLIGSTRPDFSLPDLAGNQRQVEEWDGKVLMVNFWASWCIPCRHEIPGFVGLQEKYESTGLRIIGIALDEQTAVDRFLTGLNVEINYPQLISPDSVGIALARAYGDTMGALPYTVLVGRDGRIEFVQFGELSAEQAERRIQPLL
ncbi:MAG: TlpA family protein disulfide reductase [Chromatiales bacterium]|jgi:thiol-disulfide isomerase/thioredoxin|nr:TlpA family protein disulfide reductase [Chromatiales bacterium]